MRESPSARAWVQVLFPRGSEPGLIAMLSAYFDDSGTHDDSDVVVYGGLIADDALWTRFEADWKAKLAAPLPGKPPLKRFHMSHCMAQRGEFEFYSKPESVRVANEFTDIIIASGVSGYGCAVHRQDWTAMVTGAVERVLGDVERQCVTNCILRSLRWARENSSERRLALIFDNRPHRREANERIFSIYQRNFLGGDSGPPEPSIAFENSTAFLPLQGADVVAWEIYQRGKEWFKSGPETEVRPNFQRLLDTGRIKAQIAHREVIENIVAKVSRSPILQEMGELIDRPAVVFPPAILASSADGKTFRLEIVVSGAAQRSLDLPQKRWSPIDPSQGSARWSRPPLLRRETSEPSRSEENSTEDRS